MSFKQNTSDSGNNELTEQALLRMLKAKAAADRERSLSKDKIADAPFKYHAYYPLPSNQQDPLYQYMDDNKDLLDPNNNFDDPRPALYSDPEEFMTLAPAAREQFKKTKTLLRKK